MVLKHVHISLSLFCEPGNVLSITQNTKEGTVLVWFGLIWFGFELIIYLNERGSFEVLFYIKMKIRKN